MDFRPGDKVKFLDEAVEGLVISIKPGNKILVITTEGFEFEVAASGLLKIANAPEVKTPEVPVPSPEEILALKEKMFGKPKVSVPNKTLKTDTLEVDLHIEELLENTSGMSSGEKLVHQLSVVRETMEQALSEHRMRVIFIHGVGNGKLKTELRRLLTEDYPSCEFFDANMGKYGFGATEVRIR